jgi:2-oxoglutarate ferredoxin oxidoreductase subunit beta
MVVICVNNGIYGMTGGQVAPTTPYGLRTETTPYGNVENAFDISGLSITAGATFVARWTVYQTLQITKTLRKALNRKGFSLIEIMSQCPVQFGRKTGMGSSTKMFDYFREASVTVARAAGMSREELDGKIVVGELLEIEKPVLDVELARLRDRLRKEAAGGED